MARSREDDNTEFHCMQIICSLENFCKMNMSHLTIKVHENVLLRDVLQVNE